MTTTTLCFFFVSSSQPTTAMSGCLSCGNPFSVYFAPVRLDRCDHYFCGNCVDRLKLYYEEECYEDDVECPFCQTRNPRTMRAPVNIDIWQREQEERRLYGDYMDTCILYLDEDEEEKEGNQEQQQ